MRNIDDIKTEFDSAVAVARHALDEFRKEPLVPSKRGGPRLNPMWRVYVQASEIAVRWCRQLKREQLGESFEDDLGANVRLGGHRQSVEPT